MMNQVVYITQINKLGSKHQPYNQICSIFEMLILLLNEQLLMMEVQIGLNIILTSF